MNKGSGYVHKCKKWLWLKPLNVNSINLFHILLFSSPPLLVLVLMFVVHFFIPIPDIECFVVNNVYDCVM